jgi:hypothetical protein
MRRMLASLRLRPSLPWWASTLSGLTSTVRDTQPHMLGCNAILQDVCACTVSCMSAHASALLLLRALDRASTL